MMKRMQQSRDEDEGLKAHWEKPALDDSGGTDIVLPKMVQELWPGVNGVYWFRKEIYVPASWAGQDLTLSLGPIDDFDETFWNGVPVGRDSVWNVPRTYTIPASEVKPGKAVIAIRNTDDHGNGGLYGDGAQMYVQPLTKQVGDVVNLDNSNGSYDMFFPLDGSNPTVAEKPMAEAISDALKGEGQNFFLEPSKVVAVVNEGNRAEVKNIDTLIAALNKMKQNIITTINENEKKAIEIDKEWATSKVNGVDIKDVVASASSAVINVHTATEE
jgi:hypothetical protein